MTNCRNPKVTPSQIERPPCLCLLFSPCAFPSIATAQRECFTLRSGKGGNGENTHDARWRRVSNQIEDIIVFPSEVRGIW